MQTDFTEQMSQRSDEELVEITTLSRDDWQPLAVMAADEELARRNIDAETLAQIEAGLRAAHDAQQHTNDSRATQDIRLVGNFVDGIVCFILTMAVLYIVDVLGDFEIFYRSRIPYWIIYITAFVIFTGYFYGMETHFQKTVGKFLTGTKVTMRDGSRPNRRDILIRTICRFVPLDNISYLFTRSGLHDRFSGTIVVRDKKE